MGKKLLSFTWNISHLTMWVIDLIYPGRDCVRTSIISSENLYSIQEFCWTQLMRTPIRHAQNLELLTRWKLWFCNILSDLSTFFSPVVSEIVPSRILNAKLWIMATLIITETPPLDRNKSLKNTSVTYEILQDLYQPNVVSLSWQDCRTPGAVISRASTFNSVLW